MIKIKTQAALNKALKAGERNFEFVAKGIFEIRCPDWVKVSVAAALRWDVLLEAWESSHVVARGSVSLSLWGKASAKLSAKCHAHIHSSSAKVTGGKKTDATIKTVREWCEFYGVKIRAKHAILYKSLNSDFSNPYNRQITYTPGTKPEAPDWDGGKKECGGGLHCSPSVSHARSFHAAHDAKYVELQVLLEDIAIHPDGRLPEKCKIKRMNKPVLEVNIDGERV
jgi:hypothetical protein